MLILSTNISYLQSTDIEKSQHRVRDRDAVILVLKGVNRGESQRAGRVPRF